MLEIARQWAQGFDISAAQTAQEAVDIIRSQPEKWAADEVAPKMVRAINSAIIRQIFADECAQRSKPGVFGFECTFDHLFNTGAVIRGGVKLSKTIELTAMGEYSAKIIGSRSLNVVSAYAVEWFANGEPVEFLHSIVINNCAVDTAALVWCKNTWPDAGWVE